MVKVHCYWKIRPFWPYLKDFFPIAMAEEPSALIDVPPKLKLVTLPLEARLQIYDHCFPPAGARIQLLPYWTHLPECRLNLPLSLYLVCRSICAELPLLSTKLRSLDNLYIIEGDSLHTFPSLDHDPHLRRFQTIIQFTERIRLVGGYIWHAERRHPRLLLPGRECAIRLLEVEPLLWSWGIVRTVFYDCLLSLLKHPDVKRRLEITLIRVRDYKDDSCPEKELCIDNENWIENGLGEYRSWLNEERKRFKWYSKHISPSDSETIRVWTKAMKRLGSDTGRK